MSTELHATIVNRMDDLARLAAEVDEWLALRELHPRVAYTVNLALEEILTNTIKYGYDDAAEHTITVDLVDEGGEVSLTCVDDGRHFDPLKAPEPDLDSPLEERQIGGVGLHLTTKMMDAISYRREGDRNVLVMKVGPNKP